MKKQKRMVDIDALIRKGDPITAAIRQGGIRAMRQYIEAGQSMVSWKDGRIVKVSPDELKRMLQEME